MKKLLTLILFSMIAFNVIHAEITWTLSDDGTLTISGTNMPDYRYDAPWNSKQSQIKKVVIKSGVTNIGKFAFYDCSALTSVTIPNSVTKIGDDAFYRCSGLKSVTIPYPVTTIGDYAFNGCSALTSVTIPNSVTTIGDYAFDGCSGLTSITLPNSLKYIGYEAFSKCSALTSINIPNSVTDLGSWAFEDCSNLASITIGDFVTNFGFQVFTGTKWLDNQPDGPVYIGKYFYRYKGVDSMPYNTKIEIKEGTIGLAGNAFYYCTNLASVTIPNSVTSIGAYAFSRCSSLTSVTIPNSVTTIGDYAFYHCSKLASVTIPNSVTNIGRDPWMDTKWFDNQPNGLIYVRNFLYKYKGSMPANTSIVVKNGTKGIIGGAFSNCQGLTSITIPNSVTSIGESAFYKCSGLKSVTIPNSVTSIEDYAFYGCSGLTSITIPNSVMSIGKSAFYGCSSLTSIACEANTPPGCGSGCFDGIDKSIPLYVPANNIDEYITTYGWKDFTNIKASPTTYYKLVDGKSYTNNTMFNELNISYTRTFNNTAWQALYIPFSMSYSNWKNNFEVAYINNLRQLDTDDDGVIDKTIMDIVKIKDGSLIPNTPYLIKAKTTGTKTLSVKNTTLYEAKENSIDCRTTVAEYTFTGTYNAIPASTLIANNYYTMGGGALIMTDGNSGLNPFRWYMKIEARSPMYNVSNAAKTITINVVGEEEAETTGVKDLQMTNGKFAVYDLNGRKVNENNLKPGIYVKNRKKFVVK